MAYGANNLLAWVVIALGINALILSFLVPDKKKSVISMVLAIVIMVAGLIQWGSGLSRSIQVRNQLRDMRSQRSMNMEEMREKFRQQSEAARSKVEQPKQ
jgi:sulfite exporter TauE/SafE